MLRLSHIVSRPPRGDGVLIDGRYLYMYVEAQCRFLKLDGKHVFDFLYIVWVRFFGPLAICGPVKAYEAVQTYGDKIEAILTKLDRNWK